MSAACHHCCPAMLDHPLSCPALTHKTKKYSNRTGSGDRDGEWRRGSRGEREEKRQRRRDETEEMRWDRGEEMRQRRRDETEEKR
jgi:Ni/Co efflux regulator RcnB